ncbi:putative deacetylase LmbE-like domain-containing protein [Corynascus novoguineensis]|uniref:N-acetylglucosaminylphosphatidylinositol deacetylase n=1 Tax=Corynascus novoguineensis TaxID=1126955 RepID=A0AAN7HF67_9PEZI|nr:putative deacetylase LmbE-like domain-containing protein [Corynascus novoguineensis]
MDWLITLGVLALALPSLYLYTVSVLATRFPTLRNKRICLLIAHPDDEAMFFAPTLLALTRPELGNYVKILCLSSGNAYGLGETRKKELIKSCMMLGVHKEDDVWIEESPDLPDSMTATWDATKISNLLCVPFAPDLVNKKSASAKRPANAPTASIDVLITFDRHGVSGHPNHASLYYGARGFISALMRDRSGWACPVDLYTLTTVPLFRKYMGFFDIVATLISWALHTPMRDRAHPGGLVFLCGLGAGGVSTAWRAMVDAHKSQMVWFRYGWITFSRYMVMNDLRLEKNAV